MSKQPNKKCLECQKDLNAKQELFCEIKTCGNTYVQKHFEWSKSYSSDPNKNRDDYQILCKTCGEELKNNPDAKIDIPTIKELNKHLPNCSGEKKNNKDKNDDQERERERRQFVNQSPENWLG